VSIMAGLDEKGKSGPPPRGSQPRPTRPQRVTIPTELSRPAITRTELEVEGVE